MEYTKIIEMVTNNGGDILTIVSLGLAVTGIYLALQASKVQKETKKSMDKFIKDLYQYGQSSFNSLVNLRNNNFRLFKETLEKKKSKYWQFKWIMETTDNIGFQFEKSQSAITVNINGTTLDYNNTAVESSGEYEFFICTITQSNHPDFSSQEKIACFYYDNNINISKKTHSLFVPDQKYKVFLNLSSSAVASIETQLSAANTPYVPRMKDFKINNETEI